jgi:Spy/CpxP family protein refolding chaperone
MEPLAKKFHERLAELRKAMKGKNTRLVELLGQKDVDPGQIEGLREEMADIQDEIQREVIAHIIESKKIFNPKQQERFLALMRQSMAEGNEL